LQVQQIEADVRARELAAAVGGGETASLGEALAAFDADLNSPLPTRVRISREQRRLREALGVA
jgi:hypothetical protein